MPESGDLLFQPVSEMSRRVKARELSPVELTRACLERIERLDPRLHAFVTVTADLAMDEARRADKEIAAGRYRGPLHGIPYGAKDLVATRGIRTTWGAKPYAEQVFDHDATVVRKLRDAGAVLLGKLAMIELAGGLGYARGDSSITGAARNPWNLERWTCGSSSGAGAAVAAGLVPFAIGSETWGSIVCPASFCGITGLRPTFGVISRHGAMALSWTLDKLGPMARSAADCETVARALAGHDPLDPYSEEGTPPAPSGTADARRLRAAFLRPEFPKQGGDGVRLAYEKALDDLRGAGVRMEEARLPDLPFESAAIVVLTAEVASAFEDLAKSGRARMLVSEGAPLSFVVARAVGGADLVKAQRVRWLCQRAMADLFAKYDVLLYPTETVTAFGATEDFSEAEWSDPAGAAGNLCGLPAVSAPCGFAGDGMPAGLAMMSGAFEEGKAIAMARHYQRITDWHRRRPPLGGAA
ncbi:MAG: amidase [Candidatus Polarisedimenticolia bacterium]